jgi:hypothetical protein
MQMTIEIMKKLIYIIATILLYNSCTQDKPVVAPPKTYPDLSGLWVISYPKLLNIDTNNNKVTFSFYPFPEYSSGSMFFIEKYNDSNTVFQIKSFYTDSSGIQGGYFRIRKARINSVNDSISFPFFTDIYGDSLGWFTGKYNKSTDKINGFAGTFYQIYCFCPYAGKKLPYTHSVFVTK